MNRDQLIKRLAINEGVKLKPYKDTRGKTTIGIGRNLDDVGITEMEAYSLCMDDVMTRENELDVALPWWRNLDEIRQQVICELAFNLGVAKLTTFGKMLAAVQTKQWDIANKEMLNSAWAGQVGDRAKRLAYAMLMGAFNAE